MTDVENEQAPLLTKTLLPEKTLIQQLITQAFECTTHISRLLPTGSVVAFQLLSPIFSNHGECDEVSRGLTAALVALCGFSCFLLSFSDSFVDEDGNVAYGMATRSGLWVIDGLKSLPAELADKYRLRFIDFMHAFMSIMVFAAVTLFDENIVNCFYPSPSDRMTQVLTILPLGVGVVCCMLFVVFPTHRHGIGFPLASVNTDDS